MKLSRLLIAAARLLSVYALAACILLGTGPAARAAVIYVKADAAGANNGAAWADAFTDLQSALAAAQPGDEIWVAAGVYKPTSGSDQTISFVMTPNAGIYGGFAGTETSRSQRDWTVNATILSGDIGMAGDASDNSYHVVVGQVQGLLDGFTISAGNAIGDPPFSGGGGMSNDSVSPTIANCTFSNNNATPTGYHEDSNSAGGGGMLNIHASPIVTNCTFTQNTAAFGGGMTNVSASSPTLSDCRFTGNTALQPDDGSAGGGLYIGSNSSLIITNCTFSDNRASVGGGLANFSSSSNTLLNCVFAGNTVSGFFGYGGGIYNSGSCKAVNSTFTSNASMTYIGAFGNRGGGGGFFNSAGTSATLIGCVFTNNSADGHGGGIYGSGTSGGLNAIGCSFTGNTAGMNVHGSDGGGMYHGNATHCTFAGNRADFGGGGMDSTGAVSDCSFTNNTAQFGGGLFGEDPEGLVTRCSFAGNTAMVHGGGMDYQGIVSFCTFTGNSAGARGGGLLDLWGGVKNCVFIGNSAGDAGGGYDNMGVVGTGLATNCAFTSNTSMTNGGGMYGSSAIHCTFTANRAVLSGGGLYLDGSRGSIVNCIFWNDSAPQGAEVFKVVGSHVYFHSDIMGSGGSAHWNAALGFDGGGNIDADPRFVDAANPAGPDGILITADDGLQIQNGSPCINRGILLVPPFYDILGTPRAGQPDIGAYENPNPINYPNAARDWILYR